MATTRANVKSGDRQALVLWLRYLWAMDTSTLDFSIDDDELAALAMAADPHAAIADDAVPFDDGASSASTLPDWYMPAAGSARPTRGRIAAAAIFIGSLLVVNCAGLCVTYGIPEIAF